MRAVTTAIIVLITASSAFAQSAPVRYEAALAREKQLRAAQPSVRALRTLAAEYEAIVERYPRSGYSDNALWQAAGLSWLAFERYGQDADRRSAARLLQQLRRDYPSGSLAKQVPGRLSEMTAAVNARRSTSRPGAPPVHHAVLNKSPEPAAPVETTPTPPAPTPAAPVASASPAMPVIRLTDIARSALPSGERLTIAMDSEPQYHEERIVNPERLFFDFRNTAAAESAKPTLERLVGGVVRDVRLGKQPDNITRLVIELEPNTRHSVFALYNPFRLVVDLERTAAVAPVVPAATSAAPVTPIVATAGPAPSGPAATPAAAPVTPRTVTRPLTDTVPPAANPVRDAGAPVVPATNSNGGFSLARQLGLGVARIVIDPGHGGHDPGAIANRAQESEVVLDIALRLEKLLLKQKGIDVVLTRRTDVFVPLEERTAIANREDADLFLSIHANVGRNATASGIETYILNFATNPEAEAVAARENAGTGMAMHSLPDIVRKIALNNKLDESRDLASAVQTSLYRGIRQHNTQVRNRGVKQAPFVVLIGAQMPSVLAEVSFVTNKKEASLLRTPAYRQRIAQSLFDAIVKYRTSLKKVGTIAAGAETR